MGSRTFGYVLPRVKMMKVAGMTAFRSITVNGIHVERRTMLSEKFI